jgi:peptidoglycan/xylan/chitin deacetylase (PgdA/CDA1 family)
MSNTSTEDINQNNGNKEQRRKRIKRIKTAIIAFSLVLLILPSVCCVFLSIKLVELQKQVNRLAILYNQEELVKKGSTFDNIAYAAEKATDEAEIDTDISIDNKAEKDDINSDADSDEEKALTDINLPQESDIYNTPDNTDLTDSDIIESLDSNEAGLPATEDTGEIGEDAADIHNIDYTAYEENDEQIVEDLLNGNINDNNNGLYYGKKVYITFDDGPSIYTDDILDILNEYGVKATFFVIGKTDSYSKEMYKRIVDEGHTLGMHSFSHKYNVIYNSVEDFDKDFTKLWNLLYDTTGSEPKIYRFPGGSANEVNKKGMKDFIKYLNKKSIVYFDWNVLNGDATKIKYTDEQLIANVLNGVKAKKTSIVLMHDAASKEATVRTLPKLLEQLLSGGAELYPLDAGVTPIQMIKADSVN